MHLSDFQTIVFDLDDTLFLERDFVRSGFHAVGQWLTSQKGWPAPLANRFVEGCWQQFQSGRRGDIFDVTLAQTGVAQSAPSVDELVSVYRQHVPTLRLLPDATALLRQLHGHPSTWIITDGPLVSQQAKVAALRLNHYVRRVVYTDHWGRRFWKPHPRAFRYVQQQSGAKAESCVYVADNPSKDFVAPRQLGWATVRIRRHAGVYCDMIPAVGSEADMDLTTLWPLCQQAAVSTLRQAA